MRKLLFSSFLLFFACVLAGTAQASGPSFNDDTPESAREAAPAPSFDSVPQGIPAVESAPAVVEDPAAPEPVSLMEESKEQCGWVTTSPGSFSVRSNPEHPDSSAPGAYLVEFKYRYTNRSDDREIVALKDAVLQMNCDLETPSGKALLTLKAEKPFLKMKKQRGSGSKFNTMYTLIVDEASGQKDESLSWQELNSRIPSDWWKYTVSHSYTVVSKAY